MNRRLTYILALAALVMSIFTVSTGFAQTVVDGELGIDLRNFGFSNQLKDTVREFSTNRTLSSHFFNVSAFGPFINSNLASFGARANFFGTYYTGSNNNEEKNLYLDPGLNGYYGEMMFFPSRRYPVQLYRSQSTDYSVRYEPNNRTDVEVLQPGLTVVRRYQGDKSSQGGMTRYSMSDKVNLLAGYQQDKSKTIRDYDFGENRDIWVKFAGGIDDPTTDSTWVMITNEIPDAEVQLFFFDADITMTIPAATEDSIMLPIGSQEVHVIPLTYYNQYSFRIDVKPEMSWTILYEDPKAPNDNDQTTTAANFGLKIGGDNGSRNETFYSYTDMNESQQDLTTFMNTLSNTATVPLSRDNELSFLTTYDKNQTKVDTLPTQLTRSFLHMSTFDHSPRHGLAALLMHSYTNSFSDPGTSPISSKVNTFTNKLGYPSRRLSHKIEMKNNATLLQDSKGYKNNQYSTMLTNRIKYYFLGTELEPRHELKYSWNKQKQPDKTSREIETRFQIRGEKNDTRLLGDIRFNTEYNYRRKSDQVGADIKGRYVFDLSVTRKFNDNYQLSLLTIHEYETFGGLSTSDNEYKSSYKFAGQGMFHEDLFISSSYMLISQKTAQIKKLLISVNAVLPILRIPVKSYMNTESRDLAGLDTQTMTSFVTKINFQFRQISVVFSHAYTRENVIVSKYSYHQLDGKISRQFGIM